MKRIVGLIITFAITTIAQSATPKIFKDIENYDTLAVQEYFNNGGSVDFVYSDRIAVSSSFNLINKKTNITLIEAALWAYNESQYENDNLKLISAKRNLNLILLQLKNSKDFQNQINRAFTLSISSGDVDIVKTIYEYGADINARCQLCLGRTALLIALGYRNNFELIKYLLSLKPDLTLTDNDGKGVLFYASTSENLPFLKIFLEEYQFDINATDKFGNTALLEATENSEYEVFNYLVEKGANLFHVNKKHLSVLHLAAYSDDELFFRHVFYLTNLPLWYKGLKVPDIYSRTFDDKIKAFIIRYTIDVEGMSIYKKVKRRNFFKKIMLK